MRVFVVDDDADFAESLAIALEGHGHTVSVAGSGEEAVRRFRAEDFDIAFMDVRLPGRNGVESFLEIRSFKPQARVVMMTGYHVAELLAQAVANGAYAVLEKPLDPARAVAIVEGLDHGGVLIADDDPDFLASLREALEGHGIQVVTCGDGREALAQATRDKPEAMVLDLRMPLLDGLATYRALVARGVRVPTLIVTAYADEEHASMASLRALSVEGILRKPFDVQELIDALDQLLHGSRRPVE
jgi:two-component system, NtrC family, response regulator HydG